MTAIRGWAGEWEGGETMGRGRPFRSARILSASCTRGVINPSPKKISALMFWNNWGIAMKLDRLWALVCIKLSGTLEFYKH